VLAQLIEIVLQYLANWRSSFVQEHGNASASLYLDTQVLIYCDRLLSVSFIFTFYVAVCSTVATLS
jgi:hypothetical protein